MAYLQEFLIHLENQNFPQVLKLWEEYCAGETCDVVELSQILQAMKGSKLAKHLGEFVEAALPLWNSIQDPQDSHEILRLILDLQTTNNDLLGGIAYNFLKDRYSDQKYFNEKIRLIGLRNRENFQGAITNYELLTHLDEGNFVYHTGGWGTGEIMDLSLVREEIVLEFENVQGQKHLSFQNAFKTLIPIQDDHFLVQRFAFPDELEEKARKNPNEVIQQLLRDLGPKTASEIKEEMCEWVIPEEDWSKWWQGARGRLKKDTKIETPSSMKKPFHLRDTEISHGVRLKEILEKKSIVGGVNSIVQTAYNYVRDVPETIKNPEIKEYLKEKLHGLYNDEELTKPERLQLAIFLEFLFSAKAENDKVKELILQLEDDVLDVLNALEIVALKKRALTTIRQVRNDWNTLFLDFLFICPQSTLRDYLLKELNQKDPVVLKEKLQNLLDFPMGHPEIFVWYFQKVSSHDNLPFSGKEGRCLFLENLLILYHYLEFKTEYRDLIKKMYSLLSGKRYALVRQIIQDTPIEFIREFLLLVSKCQTLSDHDQTILRSLAEVAHPSLKTTSESQTLAKDVLWTTEKGYLKTQERIQQIGTVEVVENAKEIEEARAHGDLRENAEYKCALERRGQLQAELKHLSTQLNKARIITPEDIQTEQVGVGTVVDLLDSKDNKISYTILGPWEADPDQNILSYQSLFAQTMTGSKKGDSFQFKNQTYKIDNIHSYLESSV